MSKRFNRGRGQGSGVRVGVAAGSLPFFTENRYFSLLLCLVLLAAACGKKMTPYAPDRVLPAPVREFRLTQEGDALVVSWLLPRENLLGQPLTQVQGCRVYRAATGGCRRKPWRPRISSYMPISTWPTPSGGRCGARPCCSGTGN